MLKFYIFFRLYHYGRVSLWKLQYFLIAIPTFATCYYMLVHSPICISYEAHTHIRDTDTAQHGYADM